LAAASTTNSLTRKSGMGATIRAIGDPGFIMERNYAVAATTGHLLRLPRLLDRGKRSGFFDFGVCTPRTTRGMCQAKVA